MPVDVYINGDDGCGAGSEDSEGEEEGGGDEFSLTEPTAPARALAALNALRKSRQHYDVVLVAQGGEEPAHRAVLAAASPYLLRVLPAASPSASYRLPDVPADALRPLLEYAYTGRLAVRDTQQALALYRAAWRLRFEPPRLHLAERLVRRLEPGTCLAVRALPDLPPAHLAALDAFIAARFDDVCRSGALASLPEIRIEMMRETSAEGGEEDSLRVADAALAWLLTRPDENFEQLCSRTHLVYVDSGGALRDCGELPATCGDAPELQQYRREAAARKRGPASAPATPSADLVADHPPDLELGGREARGAAAVLAARPARAGGARALLALRGRLAAARVSWSEMAAGTAHRGGALGGADAAPGERRAPLATARAALGLAALPARLLACGGYDRSRVHGSCEAYDPATNAWTSVADMRVPRARFPAARLGDMVYAVGGSDGHAELDSVEAWSMNGASAGKWTSRAKLPLAVSHAAAAGDEGGGALYAVGGWAGGAHLRRVLRYDPAEDKWSEAPALGGARAQAAAAVWGGALWALGGCDAWHCLATTERLALGGGGEEAAWEAGPALPTARRSVGAAAWRGRLVAAGGSDGAASLRRTESLGAGEPAWRGGPALRRARAALGLAVLGDVLYAAGGFDGKEFLASVECLYHPDGEWTELREPPPPPPPLPAPPPPRTAVQEDTQ